MHESWTQYFDDYKSASRSMEMAITADGWYYLGKDSILVQSKRGRRGIAVTCWNGEDGRKILKSLIELPVTGDKN